VPHDARAPPTHMLTRDKSDTEELHNLRRALNTLTACNHAVAQAIDERAFVQEVCDLVVEHGYLMAWVAAKRVDERRSVEVVAAAGVDDGYTACLQVRWDDSPAGQGAIGSSIRTGSPAVERFTADVPESDTPRSLARERGFASSISLPYRLAGEVTGALCIYSGEPDAFDAHETAVLEELALGLGQGLQALRERGLLRTQTAELLKLNDRLQRLARAVQELSAARDLDAVTAVVRTAARDLVGADGATFVLRDGDQRHHVDEEPIAPGVYWADVRDVGEDDLRILQALADATSTAMERVRTRRELEVSEERYRSIVENVEDVVFLLDPKGRFQYVSPSISKYGFTPEDIIGHPFEHFVHQADLPGLDESLGRALEGEVETRTFRARTVEGVEHVVRTTSRALVRGGTVVGVSGVLIDITELRRAEEQLRVAQKMEAVGQLAGGVAHDFNNLLSVILSYAGFVADAVRDREQAFADVEEIRKAGERAASLTRQLLVFSRKQVLQPQVIDLNQLARDCEKMLRRLIGEDIELVQRLAADIGPIKADPGQVEQVIMNLVVNARDAMPGGGKLTIETSNVEIGKKYSVRDAAVKPGQYVMLVVTDTGVGMDDDTKQRLFEPFFTTKEVGKGTGLGLSTVYGIVRESGGSIWVFSELGIGTTFKIYFPRLLERTSQAVRAKISDRPEAGTEAILLVEDDRSVRRLAVRVLRGAGYEVVEAGDGNEALRSFEQRAGDFQLLLTDVVMPNMSGRQLAERLSRMQPGIKILYMSGYTDNAIERHGVLDPDTAFIGKPFTGKDLSKKVREVLDAKVERADIEAGSA
jgi:PAS domain S-box-containing protein